MTRSNRPPSGGILTALPACTLDSGYTKNREVIFFQIDVQSRCRTGIIMMYDSATGHRIKDENTPGRITWVHSRLKNRLPKGWTLTQCLFGEHLLTKHPDSKVALVESEKTAVIAAGILPKYVWLATGGKSQFNARTPNLRLRPPGARRHTRGPEESH